MVAQKSLHQRSRSDTQNENSIGGTPDALGHRTQKYVRVIYICGDWICDGPQRLPLTQLWDYCAQARIDLSEQARHSAEGDILHWEIQCQHYLQKDFFSMVLDWVCGVPQHKLSKHARQRLEFDPGDRVLPTLAWEALFLLDVSYYHLKLQYPLDLFKIRKAIWARHTRDGALSPGDLHLAWSLLKPKLLEGRVSAGSPRTCTQHERTSSAVAQRKVLDDAKKRDNANTELLKSLKGAVSESLDRRGIAAYDQYIRDLRDVATCWDEDNDALVQDLEANHKERNHRVVPHVRNDSHVGPDLLVNNGQHIGDGREE